MNRRAAIRTACGASAAAAAFGPRTFGAKPGQPSGLRPALCAYSFRNELKSGRMTYADLLRLAAETGVDGVDLTVYWLPDTSDATLLPLKRLALRLGLSIYSLGIRARMAQPTAALQDAELAALRPWLGVAERLGAGHIRVFGGDVPKGATEDQAVAWAAETLKRCAEEAGRRGVVLGLEDDGGITTTGARTAEIVRRADSQWAGITLDVGNFVDDPYRQIEICAPLASNVHFKSHVTAGGKRQAADWPRILEILRRAGYRGYLALEYELEEDPRSAAPPLIARLRTMLRGD